MRLLLLLSLLMGSSFATATAGQDIQISQGELEAWADSKRKTDDAKADLIAWLAPGRQKLRSPEEDDRRSQLFQDYAEASAELAGRGTPLCRRLAESADPAFGNPYRVEAQAASPTVLNCHIYRPATAAAGTGIRLGVGEIRLYVDEQKRIVGYEAFVGRVTEVFFPQ